MFRDSASLHNPAQSDQPYARFAVFLQRHTVNPNRNLRLGAGVSQLCQPLPKHIFAGGGDLALNFDHSFSVTYKLS